MKKLLFCLLCVLTFSMLTGCDEANNSSTSSGGSTDVTYTVTFIQDGCENVTITVKEGDTLYDVPIPKSVVGHTVVWSKTNFENISSNITVNAVITTNEYSIRYHIDDETDSIIEQRVVYGTEYTLSIPTKDGFFFDKWVIKGTNFVFEAGTYLKAGDTELVPVFIEDENSDKHWSGLI